MPRRSDTYKHRRHKRNIRRRAAVNRRRREKRALK